MFADQREDAAADLTPLSPKVSARSRALSGVCQAAWFYRRLLADGSSWPWGECAQEVVRDHLKQVPRGIFPFANRVSSIGVSEHGERFVVLDQLVD